MSVLDKIHEKYVFNRRVRVISSHIAPILPENAEVLDVGCGDGLIDRLILEHRPDVNICGIDVLIRPHTYIPVTQFDGRSIPFKDNEFDVVMFVDVLHHTEEPEILLKEAERVSNKCIIIKDHCKNGFLAEPILRFMDWVGNARHGVVLPYNYWDEMSWKKAFESLNLKIDKFQRKLGLYPPPASWVFERGLHFIALLTKNRD